MENIIVIVLLVIIVLFALRATIKRLKGKGGCCSGAIRISILFGWWGGLAFGWGLSWGSFGFGGVVGL